VDEENASSSKRDELKTLLQSLPQLTDELRKELELLLGKRLTIPSPMQLISAERKIKRLYPVVQRLEDLKNQALTPQSARERLSLLNHYLRLIIPKIPRNQEPLVYLIESLEHLRAVPQIIGQPDGLDFPSKCVGLRMFIDELVLVVPQSSVEEFLNHGILEHRLMPQLQRVLNDLSFPKGLGTPPKSRTAAAAEKLKLTLHDVTTDWGAFIDAAYGLILLKEGKTRSWANIRKAALWDKVEKVKREPNLAALAKSEWVTVRNAVDHGTALFIPSRTGIEFQDINRSVFWTLKQTYLQAADIYLANVAMLGMWNIAQTAGLTDFKEQVAQLRVLAQQ
jgi:hypothetical protein